MNTRKLILFGLTIIAIVGLVSTSGAGVAASTLSSKSTEAESAIAASNTAISLEQNAPNPQDPLILSYAAKFVCTEALQPGMYWYGPAAPIVEEKTDVVIHNPNYFPVTLYKKAVIAPLEEDNPVPPGKWKTYNIGPDFAFRIDCDDIAKLLTNDPAATFIGKYGIGVTVIGYVVIGVGPQQLPGRNLPYANLDVTAEYARSSEVLKKDIHFVPWWRYWWWNLPWRLAYPYSRIIPIQPSPSQSLDCRNLLFDALTLDAETQMANPQERALTIQALHNGRNLDPTVPLSGSGPNIPILAAMISECEVTANALVLHYFLVSNRTPSDANPITNIAPNPVPIRYPWKVGYWYDLPVVTPQNINTDLGDFFNHWQTQRWVDVAGANHTPNIQASMVHFFPLWCGLRFWWPWWNSGDCIDIGVGEGESLDVEAIFPTRVFMQVWPPPLN